MALLLPRCAMAVPHWFSGFEAVSADAGTAKIWYESPTETGTSTLSYPVVENQASIGAVHNASNGGDATSHFSKYYTAGTTATIYDAVPVTPKDPVMCAQIALHADAAPGTATDVLALVESVAGATYGCGVRVTTSKTFNLWYRSLATFDMGTTADNAQLRAESRHCSTDPTMGCTTGTDCVSGTCSTCTISTGAGCYFGGLELCQSSGGAAATCELWFNGRRLLKATVVPSVTPTKVEEVRFGIIAKAGSATTSWHIDDILIDDATRSGFGYAQTLTPITSGYSPNLQWTKTGGGGGGLEHYNTVDDFGQSPYTADNTTYINAAAVNRTDDMTDFTAPSVIPAGASIPGVRSVIVGRANNTGGGATRSIISSSLYYATALAELTKTPSDIGNSTGEVAVAADTTDKVLMSHITLLAPILGGKSWSVTSLGNLGHRLKTGTGSTSGVRVNEILDYAWVRRPDVVPPATFRDGNLGTNDGISVFASTGDSLNGATASTVCSGGSSPGADCTSGITHYCSWDSVDRDEPNCLGVNANCIVCAGRQSENNGSGYSCVADANCPASGDTCNSGTLVCNLNDRISCTVATQAADCNGLGGSCLTGATCIESCPGGGFCPGHGGWGANVLGNMSADVILVCSHGAESSKYMVDNRLADTLAGSDGYCSAAQGTGACGCTANGDCDANVCTSGKCVGGADAQCVDNTGCKSCSSSADCGTNGRCYEHRCSCMFPPVDVLAILEGVNDARHRHNPECNEPDALDTNIYDVGGFCNQGADTACITDSTCTSAIGQGSYCAGYNGAVGPSDPCANNSLSVECTTTIKGCRQTSECPAGQSCTVNEPTALGQNGRCTCGADADPGTCTAPFKCKNSYCRRKCSNDAGCVTQGSPYAGVCSLISGTCLGRCTTPCEAATCTTDNDCPVRTGTHNFQTFSSRGQCVSGHCTGCGYAMCPLDSTTAWTRKSLYGQEVSRHFGLQYQRAVDYTLAQGDSDGTPVIIGGLHPRYNVVQQEGVTGCAITKPDASYLEKGNWWVRQHLSYIFDIGPAFDQRPTSLTYNPDGVHFLDDANVLAGAVLAERVNALNTCAQGVCLTPGTDAGPPCGADADCTGGATCYLANAIPSRYCRNANASWPVPASQVKCDALTLCTSPLTCEPLPCSCTCTTDKDCTNWYGVGALCTGSPKKCTISGTDACTSVHGATYSCNTTTKKCETSGGADICTGTLDVCRPT